MKLRRGFARSVLCVVDTQVTHRLWAQMSCDSARRLVDSVQRYRVVAAGIARLSASAPSGAQRRAAARHSCAKWPCNRACAEGENKYRIWY